MSQLDIAQPCVQQVQVVFSRSFDVKHASVHLSLMHS